MKTTNVKTSELHSFVIQVLTKIGITEEDAVITADVLLAADKRGVRSHGVARLKRYVDGVKNGVILPNAKTSIIKETPVSIVADVGGGMGHPATHKIALKCIKKAKESYMCFASIRNSNHYGIAGYYTRLALDAGMIGISMTNSAPLVVPTFGKEAVVGTNPISVGVPTEENNPFLLDMTTSVAPRGKLEVYNRQDKAIPEAWAVDENGVPTEDASKVLKNLLDRKGGGILPLGGSEELTGSHKGYNLAALVDIFCGILSSGAVGKDVNAKKDAPAQVSHFFGVINPEAFTGPDEVKSSMDNYINMLKNSEKAEGQERVYVAGEKEYEAEAKNMEVLEVQTPVFETLNRIGEEFGINLRSSSDVKVEIKEVKKPQLSPQ